MAYPSWLPEGLTDPDALDALGVPALALDAQDCTLCWNREFLRLFPEHDGHIHRGEPYAENLRRFYRRRLDAQEMPNIEHYVADGVERHRRQSAPFEFQHRDQWLRVEVVPLPDGGRLRVWTPAAAPRDGDTLAARIAVSGKQGVDSTIEEIADGLILRDAGGRIVRANRRFAEIYGLASPAQAVGKSFLEVLDAACGRDAVTEEARRHWADNSRFPGAPFDLPLPGDRWVRVREHRAHDGSLIGTHVDVTDLCRLQRSAREAQQRAEQLAAMLTRDMEERKRAEAQTVQVARLVALGQMATGLAHELNQPLAIMTLAAENAILGLRRRGAEAIPEALQRLERIIATAVRARGIVDHLRVFGRAEDGDQAPEPVDLNEVAKGALLLTEAAFHSAGIALEVLLPATPPWARGRPIPLEQAILNLLLNARDAVEEKGSAEGRIRLEVGQQDGQAVITVADNGGGFSATALQRALEPFFTTKEVGKGTGLGLSLAYSTVRAAGGSVTLGNEGDGAVVRIALPATEAPVPGAAEPPPAAGPRGDPLALQPG